MFSHQNAQRGELAPGYYFTSPMIGSKGWGPQIYTNNGVSIGEYITPSSVVSVDFR